jgi:KAP family P-loop domain
MLQVSKRRQSRLAAEIIAERRLPERIAAERARNKRLRRALAARPVGWHWLSAAQRSRLEVAVRQVDPDLPDEIYRLATVPFAWLRVKWMLAITLLRALPWWLIVCGVLVLAGVAGLVSLTYFAIAGAVGLAGLAGLLASIAAYRDTVRNAIGSVRKLRNTTKHVLDRWTQQTRMALEVSDAAVAALQRELQDLTAAGQLAGLVTDRVAAGGYRRTMGLMTQIREDFERMAELLAQAGMESPDETDQEGTDQEGDLSRVDVAGDELPAIDRIVLYIDDLDRCPPNRVVEMLEAVHLLLAIPLFVVVVAVDPRWLLRAIAVHYREVLAPTAITTSEVGMTEAPEVDPDDDGHWASTPAQYLEKIFQVVFTLPPMTTTGYTTLLDDLLGPRADSTSPASASAGVDAQHVGAGLSAEGQLSATAEVVSDDGDSAIDLPAAPVVERIDPFALDAEELTLMKLLGPPLITTPRSVKRLANSYGLLTAIHRLSSDGPSAATARYPAMVLLAALVGFPNLGPALLTHLYQQPTSTWREFVKGLEPYFGEHWRNNADPHLTPIEAQSWHALTAALVKITDDAAKAGITLAEEISFWADWVIPVGRLSFPAGRVVTGLLRNPGGFTEKLTPTGGLAGEASG